MSDRDFLDWLYRTIVAHYGNTLGNRNDKIFEFKRLARKRIPPIATFIVDQYVLAHPF